MKKREKDKRRNLIPPPVNMRGNTVRQLCLLILSVLCSVFVPASFLQNPKKKLGHFFLLHLSRISESRMMSSIVTILNIPVTHS